jgi:hypothetical protein
VSFKGPAVSISESQDLEDRESREPMHCGIEKLETPTSDKTVVTEIVVMWTRSLAWRANGNWRTSGF